MTATDGDGIDQELSRAVSAAMIAAARASEQIARMNQTAAREREARAAGDTIEAQRQLDAHTESARAYFEVVTRPEYLGAATDEQIQEVTRQARAWRERLPEAQRAEGAAWGELGARHPTDRDSERAAVLAGEADAADRRASEPESEIGYEHEAEDSGLEPVPTSDDPAASSVDGPVGQQTVATAEAAQARPTRDAPVASPERTPWRRAQKPATVRRRQSSVER